MDQGRSAMDGGPPPPATGTFALDLSRAGVTLYWLSSHAVWNAVEHVVLQEGLVAERMGRLRARIGGLPEPAHVDVWLPEDQVIVRVLETGGAMPTEQMVAGLFADLPGALEFDAEVRQGATAHTIAAIPRAVLEQTRDFLQPHGFAIDTCTVRDAPAGMDHAPVFSLDPPAAAPGRAMPPRAGLAAAGAGLLLGGGLLVGLLLGVFGDPPPRAPLVAMDGLAGPVADDGSSGQAPGSGIDLGGRAGVADDIDTPDRVAAFAAPENRLAVGRARVDQPLPRTPAPAGGVGPLPQTDTAPLRDAGPGMAPMAARSPQAPAIFARPVQTEIAAPPAPGLAGAGLPPAARQWTRHAAVLPAAWLGPVAGAGDVPDLSVLRAVPQPTVMVLDPVQSSPRAGSRPTAVPQTGPGSYVALLPGELDPPAEAPAAADFSGVRSRPASVAPLIMVSLAMPDAAGDSAARAPAPEAALPRPPAATAPALAERRAPLAEFALSVSAGRPALTRPGDSLSAPGDGSAPAGAALKQVRALPPAGVSASLDRMPAPPVPDDLRAPSYRTAGDSALDAVLLDILAAARPGPATSAPALAMQPPHLVTPGVAGLPGPASGVRVGRPQTGTVPQVQIARAGPDTAPAMTGPVGDAPPAGPVDLAASGGNLPRVRVVAPGGTVPPRPKIESAARPGSLSSIPDGTDARPGGASGPGMAAPTEAPGAVSIPQPALPPASDTQDVEVAVINARPDIVPPLRPTPQVIEARPDIVPPLRDAADAAVEVAALTDAAPETDGATADPASQVASIMRPRPRPAEIEAAQTVLLASLAPSELALNRTDAPRRRPSDLVRVQPAPAPAPTPTPAPAAPSVAAPEPKRAAPVLPTAASVARAATIKDALPFGRMALIGVFGSTRSPHALLRTRNGDFIKVRNGDTVDGYQVSGMSGNAIRLRRGGRETLLVIPQ